MNKEGLPYLKFKKEHEGNFAIRLDSIKHTIKGNSEGR